MAISAWDQDVEAQEGGKDPDQLGQGPVGDGQYIVRQGDCIASIAADLGFSAATIWNHSQNAELKRVRKSPNILLPGDRVFIPEKTMKQEIRPTDQVHRFKRKSVPERLKIQLRIDGKPRKRVGYEIVIDGQWRKGVTDDEGGLDEYIPPTAKSGRLFVRRGQITEEFELNLGHMDPIEEISGVQARLNNLGFNCGEPDGEMNDETAAALDSFQASEDITRTGLPDQQTRDALVKRHGS